MNNFSSSQFLDYKAKIKRVSRRIDRHHEGVTRKRRRSFDKDDDFRFECTSLNHFGDVNESSSSDEDSLIKDRESPDKKDRLIKYNDLPYQRTKVIRTTTSRKDEVKFSYKHKTSSLTTHGTHQAIPHAGTLSALSPKHLGGVASSAGSTKQGMTVSKNVASKIRGSRYVSKGSQSKVYETPGSGKEGSASGSASGSILHN